MSTTFIVINKIFLMEFGIVFNTAFFLLRNTPLHLSSLNTALELVELLPYKNGAKSEHC